MRKYVDVILSGIISVCYKLLRPETKERFIDRIVASLMSSSNVRVISSEEDFQNFIAELESPDTEELSNEKPGNKTIH